MQESVSSVFGAHPFQRRKKKNNACDGFNLNVPEKTWQIHCQYDELNLEDHFFLSYSPSDIFPRFILACVAQLRRYEC